METWETDFSNPALATAAEHLDLPRDVVDSIHALQQMSPADPAGLHYRAAVQYHTLGDEKLALRNTLQALEEAPRFRAALQLLVELKRVEPQGTPSTDPVE